MFVRLMIILITITLMTGCSSLGLRLKNLFGGGASEELPEVVAEPMPPRYSENPNLYSPVERRYRRMTQERLEEENEVHSRAGSLWSMEGQKAYLFSQNTSRREGDLLNVNIMGAARNQIATKVDVIKELLARIEDTQERVLASVEDQAEGSKAEASAKEKEAAPAKPKASAETPRGEDGEEASLAVTEVPTKIIEQLPDGNYRVKGSQPFMIGQNQYKVIVTGIVRAEDFNDEGINTDKLLDPQYDVVSLRRVSR